MKNEAHYWDRKDGVPGPLAAAAVARLFSLRGESRSPIPPCLSRGHKKGRDAFHCVPNIVRVGNGRAAWNKIPIPRNGVGKDALHSVPDLNRSFASPISGRVGKINRPVASDVRGLTFPSRSTAVSGRIGKIHGPVAADVRLIFHSSSTFRPSLELPYADHYDDSHNRTGARNSFRLGLPGCRSSSLFSRLPFCSPASGLAVLRGLGVNHSPFFFYAQTPQKTRKTI